MACTYLVANTEKREARTLSTVGRQLNVRLYYTLWNPQEVVPLI